MALFTWGVSRPFALALVVIIAPAAPAQEAPIAVAASEAPLLRPAVAEPARVEPGHIDPALVETAVDFLRLGEDMSDRMTLPVEIGRGGPYNFIIDTGSHRSIVASELAQRLDLPELPPVEIISMAGRETVASVQLDQMKYGTQIVSDLPALSIAHDALGSAGLIGLDGLKNKRLTLDFRKNRLTVGKSKRSDAISAMDHRLIKDSNVIVVEARSKMGQLILINSRLDGKRVNVILDTGAEMSIGNMALFRTLKLNRLVLAPKAVEIKSVTGQAVPAQFTIVRKLDINSVTMRNVPMVFLDAAPFDVWGLGEEPSMLLGMGLLRMFDEVAIDFGNRRVDFHLPSGQSGGNKPERLFAAL